MSPQSDWNGKLLEYRKNGENWRPTGVLFPGTMLTASSCCFVSLIVFLRFLIVKHPLRYGDVKERIGYFGSIIIWIFSLLVNLVPVIISIPSIFEKTLYANAHIWSIRITHVFPVCMTLISYGMLLYTLRQTSVIGGESNRRKRSLLRMVHGIVIMVIICNVPYIAWWEWLVSLFRKKDVTPAFVGSGV